jgi:hypothetical protein
MLHQGIIRPITSSFSTLVLLVCKDKRWRFHVDYHELNAKMVKDKFPILIVNELLDLCSGYH